MRRCKTCKYNPCKFNESMLCIKEVSVGDTIDLQLSHTGQFMNFEKVIEILEEGFLLENGLTVCFSRILELRRSSTDSSVSAKEKEEKIQAEAVVEVLETDEFLDEGEEEVYRDEELEEKLDAEELDDTSAFSEHLMESDFEQMDLFHMSNEDD